MIHKEAASLDSLEADVCSSNNSSAIAYSFLVDSLELELITKQDTELI